MLLAQPYSLAPSPQNQTLSPSCSFSSFVISLNFLQKKSPITIKIIYLSHTHTLGKAQVHAHRHALTLHLKYGILISKDIKTNL